MKHRDALSELRLKSTPELVTLLKEQEAALLKLRFDVAFRKLKNTSGLKTSRKTIAQIQTIIREKLSGTLSESAPKEQ